MHIHTRMHHANTSCYLILVGMRYLVIQNAEGHVRREDTQKAGTAFSERLIHFNDEKSHLGAIDI